MFPVLFWILFKYRSSFCNKPTLCGFKFEANYLETQWYIRFVSNLLYLFVSIKTDSMVTFLTLLVLKDSCWVICHQDRQPVLEGQKHSGPVAGLQFIDWVSVEDIWGLLPLFTAQYRSLTEEINEAQLCKIGVKYVQLWLHIDQKALFDFSLDSIHYQNGLQRLFIKNKLMLINSDCIGH